MADKIVGLGVVVAAVGVIDGVDGAVGVMVCEVGMNLVGWLVLH